MVDDNIKAAIEKFIEASGGDLDALVRSIQKMDVDSIGGKAAKEAIIQGINRARGRVV